ncbi:MAG: fucose isomerase [Planctomycetaceae bacterium]|nr:hypothetical protein [Planctomycetaceae bacterium]
MTTSNCPLLGVAPIGKFVFSHEDAMAYKARIEALLTRLGVNYVNLDAALPDGMVRDQRHVDAAVNELRGKNIDALFLPHCNFGTEGAAGMIARKLNVPTLLWGPRDEAPLADGSRLRDTLCGLFASSKVLRKLGVTFTYIENCRMEEPALAEGIVQFMAAANVVKGWRRMRIGMVGKRIDFFYTCIVNESELLERFGIEIVPIDLIDIIAATRTRAAGARKSYLDEIEQLKTQHRLELEGFDGPDAFINVLALRDEMLHRATDLGLTAFAIESFMSICNELGSMIEFVHGELAQSGIPCSTETDIHGAISCQLLQHAAMGAEPTFLADLTIRHPSRDDAVLLWHCGFPLSLAHPQSRRSVGPHWILPGIEPGSCHWRMKDGPLTVCRFDGDTGSYRLCSGQGETCQGPDTQNVYAWMKVADWPKWERTFIMGPYIHHVAAAYGHHAAVLKEASRYMNGVEWESPEE